MGYDLESSAARFSNYLHVLRELVHLSCGHLALEPRFEVKALLGDHLHDDARAVSKLQRVLPTPVDAPSEELAALLDRAAEAATRDYLEIAYGELKPTLIAALRVHLAGLDPLVDEPSLRLVTQLVHRQERHVAELPAGRTHIAFEDLGALPLRAGEVRALKILPPLDRPERDGFIEITDLAPEPDERGHLLHALMDAELSAAELTARNSHEHPDMPWDFHVDMARQCWDEIRHAEIHDRQMAELGSHWGDHPVGFDFFRSVYGLDLPGRLAQLDDLREQVASHRRTVLADETIARLLEADEVPHARNAARWGTYLVAPT
jgi:hypothetical protein